MWSEQAANVRLHSVSSGTHMAVLVAWPLGSKELQRQTGTQTNDLHSLWATVGVGEVARSICDKWTLDLDLLGSYLTFV